jgi:YD repeat-containing protein
MDTAMPIVTYTYDPIGKLISITTDGATEKADCTFPFKWAGNIEEPTEPQSLVVTYTYDANSQLRAIFRPDGTVEEIDTPSVPPIDPPEESEEE